MNGSHIPTPIPGEELLEVIRQSEEFRAFVFRPVNRDEMAARGVGRYQCAWCGCDLGPCPGIPTCSVSHLICGACSSEALVHYVDAARFFFESAPGVAARSVGELRRTEEN